MSKRGWGPAYWAVSDVGDTILLPDARAEVSVPCVHRVPGWPPGLSRIQPQEIPPHCWREPTGYIGRCQAPMVRWPGAEFASPGQEWALTMRHPIGVSVRRFPVGRGRGGIVAGAGSLT